MPRSSVASSSSSKRQPLHHNNSQSGLVPPATPKRASRSRSSSSTASSVQASTQEVSTAATQFHVGNGTATTETSMGGWDGKGSVSKFQECLDMADLEEGERRKIDINPSGTSSDTLPATVLPSFPLLDTLTLLIVFLQLPSTVLTIIHFLFATQTFIGPNTTLLTASTTFSLPSFTTLLLQGSNGTPSLLTIIFADILVAAVSMFLWPSARSFLIEFAQAVIAISLGAGSSSQNGGSLRNAAVCAGVMGGVKVVQGRFRLSDAWDTIQPNPAESGVQMMMSRSGHPTSWIRNAIAIHIVANGCMRATRTWLMRRSEEGDASGAESNSTREGSTNKQKDPEAAVGAAPQPLERENSVSGKRKKKNQIQTFKDRQPLWGTIANAIVHVAKQVEQSQVSSEANSTAGDAGSSNESLMNGEEGRVWITNIGSVEVSFIVDFFGPRGEDGRYQTVGSADEGSPFFARVNGIVWPQTEIYRIAGRATDVDEDEANKNVSDARGSEEWAVDVTGLTGATEYDFEFVRRKGEVFYRTSACTVPALASTRTTPAKQQPSRPLSPVTTLRHSLDQAKATLEESKSKLKAAKKAHKSGLSEIRKEIEKNRSLLGNDRGEERAFRRNLALRESVKRAEEEMDSMIRELEELQTLPDKLKPQWQEKKRQWQEERRRLVAAQNRAAQDKAAADSRAKAVESDAAAVAAKKEKLVVRLNKLEAELEKQRSENPVGSGSFEKRQAERETMLQQRDRDRADFEKAIIRAEHLAAQAQQAATDNWALYYALEATVLQQQQQQVLQQQQAQQQLQHAHQQQQAQMAPPTPESVFSHPVSVSMSPFSGMASDLGLRGRSYSTFSDESVLTNPSEMGSVEFYQGFSKLGHNDSFGHASDPSIPSLASVLQRKASE